MSQPDSETPPGIPRWVKIGGIIVILLILLVVVLKLTGIGGDHGPSRHAPGMLTGFALLAVRHGTALPAPEDNRLESDTVADDHIPFEENH